jgi:hypothetical protein
MQQDYDMEFVQSWDALRATLDTRNDIILDRFNRRSEELFVQHSIDIENARDALDLVMIEENYKNETDRLYKEYSAEHQSNHEWYQLEVDILETIRSAAERVFLQRQEEIRSEQIISDNNLHVEDVRNDLIDDVVNNSQQTYIDYLYRAGQSILELPSSFNVERDESYSCPICTDNDGDDWCYLPCNTDHKFHRHCIAEDVNRNSLDKICCPLCRSNALSRYCRRA